MYVKTLSFEMKNNKYDYLYPYDIVFSCVALVERDRAKKWEKVGNFVERCCCCGS